MFIGSPFFAVRAPPRLINQPPFIMVQIIVTLKRIADMMLLEITDLKYHSPACHRQSSFQVACSETRGKYYVLSTSRTPETGLST
jgi:hypothetical protein